MRETQQPSAKPGNSNCRKQGKLIVARHEALMNESNVEPAPVLSASGWKAWRERDYSAAHASFRAALKKDETHEAARNGLGWTHLHLGDHDSAIKEFRIILESSPEHGGAKNGLGQALAALGQWKQAEAALAEATHDAIESMGEATTVKNQVTASWFGLIRVLIEQGKVNEASDWIERFLKHAPNDPMMLQLKEQLAERQKGS